ncbi:glycosyltransferase family 2 protein [Planococcus shixiaomingii]|uniref:glycosyltransferase family 2 protein n=1 Tax=Planococcus shixiaomingii TaxID=3058393 RepID=UPI00260958E2|nr:glycosyltransferase [Planococcus sp. N022]WKA53977.1 glycosyltransferase [Planococcus sp. N022]
MKELVSVIMSTYNEEPDWIRASIDSIINQSYCHLEFIIILDNPNDLAINKLLKDYEAADDRIKVIVNEKNLGLVNSLNIALKHCKGSYIARMDADDISEQNRLQIQKEYLENNNLDFVYSGMTIINEKGNRIKEWPKKTLTHLEVQKGMQVFNVSTHPTWFVKKEVYTALGGYRNIPFCEDYDFSLRALNQGYKIGRIAENLLEYRVRSTSISRSNSLEQFLICRKISKLNKNQRLEEMSFVNKEIVKVRKLFAQSSDKKFPYAESYYQEGVDLYKKGHYIRAILKFFNSVLASKYILLKMFDLFKYKILM